MVLGGKFYSLVLAQCSFMENIKKVPTKSGLSILK
jgi:hypothetical protein